MIDVIDRERFGWDWYDVWRVTCDLCGRTIVGIDALVDASERGWNHVGPIDECPECIRRGHAHAE